MRITVLKLAIAALVAVAATASAFVVVVGLSEWHERRDLIACRSNVYNLASALEMYAMDYGRYPSADRWNDLLSDYVKNPLETSHCPRDRSAARSSYGMNAALSGRSTVSVPEDVVRIYETAHPGDNPHGGPDDVAVPPRHQGGNMYCSRWPGVEQDQAVPKFGH